MNSLPGSLGGLEVLDPVGRSIAARGHFLDQAGLCVDHHRRAGSPGVADRAAKAAALLCFGERQGRCMQAQNPYARMPISRRTYTHTHINTGATSRSPQHRTGTDAGGSLHHHAQHNGYSLGHDLLHFGRHGCCGCWTGLLGRGLGAGGPLASETCAASESDEAENGVSALVSAGSSSSNISLGHKNQIRTSLPSLTHPGGHSPRTP